MIRYMLNMLSKCKFNKKAFTLTEVLLAIMIVGIIAMLVMPAVVTYYQNNLFQQLQARQVQAINNALGTLVINENKVKFSETVMNIDTPGSTDETIGKFIKKYLRVSKYCGAPTGGNSACFADKYYEYVGGDKKVVPTASLSLEGACGQLKNGVSLCLTRQNGGDPARVVMDLNGPKGPNIVGRDFIRSQQLQFQASKDIDRVADKDGVYALDHVPLDVEEYNPCASAYDKSTACCNWRKSKGQITTPTHKCCENPSIKESIPACTTTVTVRANYNYSADGLFYSRPYLSASGTDVSPSTFNFPADPALSIMIICDGTFEGTPTMGASTLKSLLLTTSGKQYFSKRLRKSHTSSGKSCSYSKKPIYWSNGSKDIIVDGVQYHMADW